MFLAVGFVLGLAPLQAASQSIRVTDAWVRPPLPGQKHAAAYIELTSDRKAALVAAGSSVAERVEMHSMTTEDGIMRMRPLPRIDLPAGQTVKLVPGGMHLMLFDVKQALKPGDKVPLTLSVQPADPAAGMSLTTVNIEAPVRLVGPPTASHRH